MQQLIDKLIEIGYDSQYIYHKLTEWNSFNNLNTNQEIELYLFDKPTTELPKTFLNINNSIKDIFIFSGNIQVYNFESIFLGNMTYADYDLDKELCLICVTKTNDIKVLKYLPSVRGANLYLGKTYENNFSSVRESIINSYYKALTNNNKLSEVNAKSVLRVLASEYVIDEIIIENSNPKIKLYNDVNEFADNITNYKYKYINKDEMRVEKVSREIITKNIGSGVKIGNHTNEPYLALEDSNQIPDFYLDKPSYVWFVSNQIGKEELAIYTAKEQYSAKTYRELLSENEDEEINRRAEEISSKFFKQLGYKIPKKIIVKALKKLNRDLVILPIKFIEDHINKFVEEISPLEYHFGVITDEKDFEAQLYVTLEGDFNGKLRYQNVEILEGNYVLLGKNIKYTDEKGEFVEEKTLANFNTEEVSVILKKSVLITSELLESVNQNDWDLLPVPMLEVLFYIPSKNVSELDKGITQKVKLYYETSDANFEKRMTNVKISYINKNGEKIKDSDTVNAWVGENFTPEIPNKITDDNGFMWEYKKEEKSTILVRENVQNEITLMYDKLKRRVKIEFVNDLGVNIKETEIIVYQVGETIQYEESWKCINYLGKQWRPKTLNKLNQKVFEEEGKNVISMIYQEDVSNVIISFVDESGKNIMKDKIEDAQIGSKYKLNQKDVIDDEGQYWTCIESTEEVDIEKGNSHKIILKCKPLMTEVLIRYVDDNDKDIMPLCKKELQVGSKYIPVAQRTYKDEENKSWLLSNQQTKEFIIKKYVENIIIIKYEPVLVKTVIQYNNIEGKEIKKKDIFSKQLGSVFNPMPNLKIKDDKGNEWQLVEKEYKPITIKESEKENIIIFVYQVAKGNVSISYLNLSGEILKPEEQFVQQVGSAFIPTPEQYLIDKENKKWRLNKVQPAMLKVKSMDNKVVVTYQPENAKVTWQYFDTEGNEIKASEHRWAQIGIKYTPIISDTTLKYENQLMKLLKIEPYEIIISENQEDNVVRLIYVKVTG